MNLYQFVKNIERISLLNNGIVSFAEGDVYDLLNHSGQTYPKVVLTLNNITDAEEDRKTVDCTFFYIDRLTDNGDNKISIQSVGITVLNQIKTRLEQEFADWEYTADQFTPFTEKFADLCAGVFTSTTIDLSMEDLCEEEGEYKEKILQIYHPGTYDVTSYTKAEVLYEKKKEEETKEVHYELTPANSSVSEIIKPDDDKNVLSQVTVSANAEKVDINETITANGDYDFSQDVFIDKAKVTVNVPSGCIFYGSNPQFREMKGNFPVNVEFPEMISCSQMFNQCTELTTVPLFDTSNVTNMNGMFNNCRALTTVPLFDTSNVTYMSNMFYECRKLNDVPVFNTTIVTNMYNMFSYCSSLISIPQLDTSNVNNFGGMFSYCSSLISIPQIDTSNGTNLNGMFSNCSSLTSVPQLNASKASVRFIFENCTSLIDFGGLLNVGKSNNSAFTYDLSYSSLLSDESIQNVIDGLYDMTEKGFSPTLKFHSTVYTKLSEAQKEQVTAKGWIIASA